MGKWLYSLALLVSFVSQSQASLLQKGGKPARPPAELSLSIPMETNLTAHGIRETGAHWVELFDSAKFSIDLGQFYFAHKEGEALGPVLAALERAAKRGVKLRAVVQKSMVVNDPATYTWFSQLPGAEISYYDLTGLTGGIIHAKYFIVDNRVAFLGSHNFDWRALSHIHELGVAVSDVAAAKKLTRIFEMDRIIAIEKRLPTPAELSAVALDPEVEGVKLLGAFPQATPKGVGDSLTELLAMLRSAKSELEMQVMTYSPFDYVPAGKPWMVMDQAIREAAARGVQVRLIMGDWSAKGQNLQYLKTLGQVKNVQIKIVTIPQWSGGAIPYARVVHSKYVVKDGESLLVSTSNWSYGYFENSRNVDFLFEQKSKTSQWVKTISQQVSMVHKELWSSPYAKDVGLF